MLPSLCLPTIVVDKGSQWNLMALQSCQMCCHQNLVPVQEQSSMGMGSIMAICADKGYGTCFVQHAVFWAVQHADCWCCSPLAEPPAIAARTLSFPTGLAS